MFPRARCEGCGARDTCAARGAVLPEYPRCQVPIRGVDLQRTAELFAWMRGASGIGADAGDIAEMEAAVIDRLRRDRVVFSDVLEPSFACGPSGTRFYRFSYAFPALGAERGGTGDALGRLCRPFGPAAGAACASALRASQAGIVEQLLFGFEGGAATRKVKLYVQFRSAAGARALALAERVLGCRLEIAAAGPLHLLGVDVGEHGLAAAKLYFMEPRVDLRPGAGGAKVPLFAELAAAGVEVLRDVLWIHRMDRPCDDGVRRPSDVDFSLLDNDLLWSDLAALPSVRGHVERTPAIEELLVRFRVYVRRVSASIGGAERLTAYYALREVAG